MYRTSTCEQRPGAGAFDEAMGPGGVPRPHYGSARLPVDVVYRRTDEHRRTGERGELTDVGAALFEPLSRGTLTCVNAFGAGVADDKLIHAYVEDMVRFYLGEEPLLASVRTYDPGIQEHRDAIYPPDDRERAARAPPRGPAPVCLRLRRGRGRARRADASGARPGRARRQQLSTRRGQGHLGDGMTKTPLIGVSTLLVDRPEQLALFEALVRAAEVRAGDAAEAA